MFNVACKVMNSFSEKNFYSYPSKSLPQTKFDGLIITPATSSSVLESSEATHYLQIRTICYHVNEKIRFALLETCKWLLWAHC